MGDGRLVLERLPSEHLDVLAMDAFSSDAVPMHLLTREAYQIYLRHLKPDGILVFNISNRYLDLEPVVAAGRSGVGFSGRHRSPTMGDRKRYYIASTWMVLRARPQLLQAPQLPGCIGPPHAARPGIPRLDRRLLESSSASPMACPPGSRPLFLRTGLP